MHDQRNLCTKIVKIRSFSLRIIFRVVYTLFVYTLESTRAHTHAPVIIISAQPSEKDLNYEARSTMGARLLPLINFASVTGHRPKILGVSQFSIVKSWEAGVTSNGPRQCGSSRTMGRCCAARRDRRVPPRARRSRFRFENTVLPCTIMGNL